MNKLTLLLLAFLCVFGVQAQKSFQLEDITNKGTFYARSVYGLRSMKSGESYTVLKQGQKIEQYAYATGEKEELIFDLKALNKENIKGIDGYQFSADERKILITTNREDIYRHSFSAEFFVYDRDKKSLEKLSEGRQQLADFSPSGEMVCFFRKNNLFVKDLKSGKETQFTFDGKYNHIINGAPDWVYEEEFSFWQAYQWSPDGKRIAYMRFDESEVKQFNMTVFKGMNPEKKANALYPENYTFKYPKAGEKNSLVSVHVYDLESKKTTTVDVGEETDQYIPRIKWTQDPKVLSLVRMNRHQNHYELLLANADNGKTNLLYEEKNKAWVDVNDDLTFLKDNKHFIVTSEKSGFNHIYLYNMKGELVRQVTKGDWEVSKYLGYDEDKKLFYYQAAAVSPLQREIYSIDIKGKRTQKLSEQEGTNSAKFSKGFKYFINYYSANGVPTVVTLHNAKGKLIRTLEDNQDLRKRLQEYEIPKREFFSFETSEGVKLNAWMMKPVGFDENKEYPALLHFYGGPGSQQVLDRYKFDWLEYLAQEGFVVVVVDNRGTGGRGEAFKKCTYMQIQNLEAIDLIETGKYMAKQPFIAADKIGVYGWSFGGQMSSLCMFRGADVFAAGIAVAPVTTYRYYDSIYSERYLRTPQENPEGYDDYAPINFADQLKGKFLLIHGTSDDNVHVQNTLELSEVLVQHNKKFEMFLYTNRNHGIYGGQTRLHLFTKMVDFLKENL
ncbi:S9 family peptidase [Marinifilum flexuosum]|uniref:Dipeptidyl-peptidase-4 n=1 Tax=Marinifilum flexuosum TaxID=1117708 RepID=A0A419X8Y5_9BACT|nr:S9 family peptidase [Marinifilum flexuosum]RKE04059.1 dipeptidyl-peptidase-4 [Marinifilum flexuosum]